MSAYSSTINSAISYEEKEELIYKLLSDFSPYTSIRIIKELEGKTELDPERNPGLSINDFINYEKNFHGREMFEYLYPIWALIHKLEQYDYLIPTGDKKMLLNLGKCYMSLCKMDEFDKDSMTSYAEFLGIDYIRYKVSPYVVPIIGKSENGDIHMGSGTLINSDTILTCAHVLAGMRVDETVCIGDKIVEIEKCIWNQDKERRSPDVGLIKLKSSVSVGKDIVFGEGTILNEILTIGYPPVPWMRDAYQISQRGEINAVTIDYNNFKHFVYSSITRPGNSGGPVFSDKGLLIGMTTEHLEKKDGDSYITIPDNYSSEDALVAVVDQINNQSRSIVPFYAGLTAEEIIKEIEILVPGISLNQLS